MGLEDSSIQLGRIPILKLPADKLEPSLEAVSKGKELRSAVIGVVLKEVYPGFDEKRAFRALVAPTLTRLHLARSEPPYFRFAPNGKVWTDLPEHERKPFIAVTLRDLMWVRLGIPESMFPPESSLREHARQEGERMVDRVRGMNGMLQEFMPYLPSTEADSPKRPIDIGGSAILPQDRGWIRSSATDILKRDLARGKVVAIDTVRYLLMTRLGEAGFFLSSFAADVVLTDLVSLPNPEIKTLRAAYARIDSLIIRGNAYSAVKLS